MFDSKFNVLGNNEYNIFRTDDNGMTWEHKLSNEGDVISANNGDGRIIIYSTKNTGLKYTDDNFATIDDSNVMDGNWESLELDTDENGKPVTNDIFASSLDGRGIWVTHDFGEKWELLSKGTADKVSKTPEGEIVLHGKDDVIKIDKDNKKPQLYPNSIYTPEGITQKSSPQMQYGLLYILNKIIIPQLSSILMGETNLKDLEYNNSSVYTKFWTDGQTYKVQPNVIDYYADVGMRPFHTSDLKDYNDLQDAAKQTIIDINTVDKQQNISPTLQRTYNLLDRIIANYRDLLLAQEGHEMSKMKEDYEGLTEDEVPTMKFFYDVKKGALMSLKGTIINSIFTFDNSKKASLLKTSILEAADFLKGRIQADLNYIANGLDKKLFDNIPEGMFQYDLMTVWQRAIRSSLSDYYVQCRNNINNISTDEDREYIAIAARKYKAIREDLLNVVVSDVVNPLGIRSTERMEDTQKSIIENFKLFQEKILGCVDLWRSAISQGQPIPRGELDSMIDEALGKYKKFNDSLKEKDPTYQIEYISHELKKQFKERMYDEINVSNKKLAKKYYFDSDDFNEEMSKLTPIEIDKVNRYYTQIMDKFKDRCFNLLDIILEGDLRKEGIDTFDIYPELFDFSQGLKNHYDDLGAFTDSHSLDFLEGSISQGYNIFTGSTVSQWKKQKEII